MHLAQHDEILPPLLRHCAILHNMVKLSLKQVRTGSNRKNQDILLQNMVKLSLKQVIAGFNSSSCH